MNKAKGKRQKAKIKRKDASPAARLLHFCPLPFAFCLLPSRVSAHGLAHVCVCVLVFLSWSLPRGLGERTRPPAAARVSEDEVDAALQRAASASLGGREGTVLVLDALTGRVRAAVNPRVAFEEATPPGSAIKPFTMLAALRAGALDEESRAFCRGRYEREGFRVACSHPRYKTPFGPAQALANSCNYFFAHVAEALDGELYARTLRDFGFGAQTRGGGDSEAAGQLPRATPGVPEMLGDSEQLRVTPAQLATAYAALFNGERLLVPQRARAEGFTPRVRATLDIAPAQRALILAGMRGAVAYGTASRAGLATLPAVYVFGKTGTSTPQDGWRAQGWFVGLAADKSSGGDAGRSSGEDKAPPERVRLAVLVFLKRSRGAEAAELARPVFEAYARTLTRRDDSQLSAQASDNGAAEASSSSSKEASGSGSSDEEGMTVRVRLSRADATLSLPLDEYVFGVLAAEGSVETEPEALKALAVIARTYALKNLRRHARDGFDLCDTTHCQRFMPVRDEGARPGFYELVRRAVRETAGEVLREPRGGVAESYFSAACGGRTADISKLWGERAAPPYLRGVRDDFCAGANQAWTDVIPSAQLLKALRADGRSDVGARLDSVRVLRRDETGRAEMIALEGEHRRTLRGWDFKIIVGRTLGWNVLKSSRFDVTRAGSAYVFRGTGFGHGLGLCQAGAHTMAARGASYRQILGQYFPGTSVGRAELRNADFGLRNDESAAGLQPHFVKAAFEASSEAVEPAALQPAFHIPHSAIEAPATSAAQPAIRNPQSAIRNHLSSEHFRVSYPARVARREVESALRTLEAAHADLSRRLENASLGGVPTVEVFIHETTGDFVGATGQPAWVAASTEGRRIELQPLDVLRRRGVLATTLRHEFVHAALEALGRGRAPRWLVEGLAVYAAGEGPQLARSAPRQKISPDELERMLARPGSPQEMRALYAAAYREVGELIRREGEASVWRRATQ
jgi:stage II sporulation protein D